MRRQLVAIGILCVFLMIGIWFRLNHYDSLPRETVFSIQALFWLNILLIAVLGANCCYNLRHNSSKRTDRPSQNLWPNRRESYRVVYPKASRPTLIIKKINSPHSRELLYPIADLSENGICFIDDGSLGSPTEVQGSIRWNDGEMDRISGQIVRRFGRRVSIQLYDGFTWKRVLEEQRWILTL